MAVNVSFCGPKDGKKLYGPRWNNRTMMKKWIFVPLLAWICRTTTMAFSTTARTTPHPLQSLLSTTTTTPLLNSGYTTITIATRRLLHPSSSSSIRKGKRRLHSVIVSSAATTVLSSSNQYLVRIVFLRAMAWVYGVAFLVALRQNKALIGDDGITPARRVLEQAQAYGTFKRQQRLQWRKDGRDSPSTNTRRTGWRRFVPKRPRVRRMIGRALDSNPWTLQLREVLWDRSDRADRPVTTLLWLAADRHKLNPWLDRIAVTGLALSAGIAVTGAANVPILLCIYLCHRSLMAVGGPWYGYGWEPQLAEIGFHAIFAVPFLSLNPLSPVPVPVAVSWCVRWHLFRVRTFSKARCPDTTKCCGLYAPFSRI
jgi:Lipase maturation factor